jgi:prophage tail gpP-like protein
VVFQGNSAGYAVPYSMIKQQHGQNVFDVLKTIAAGRGLQFWCTEEGKLVFGKPISAGKAAFVFSRTDKFTNILESDIDENIEDGFSKVFVYGQSQGVDMDTSGAIVNSYEMNDCETASLPVPAEFPFYKPKCMTISGDATECRRIAQLQLNLSKLKALSIVYTVAGHSQGGVNYKTNTMAHIDDDKEDIHGDFLLFGRTFSMNKETGPITTVRLGRPGVVLE